MQLEINLTELVDAWLFGIKYLLAETGVHVALQIAPFDSVGVAVAHFAPEDGVEAKSFRHALVALFSGHLRRTNAGA